MKWCIKYIIYGTVDVKSNELWSSQLWTQLRIEGWKIQEYFCVELSVSRLFHVGHVVQNSARCTFAYLARMFIKWKQIMKDWLLRSRCRQNLKYDNFTASFGRLHQKIAPKSVPHHYFSSFNQSNHWFMALRLPLSFIKLPIDVTRGLRSRVELCLHTSITLRGCSHGNTLMIREGY